MALVNKEKVQLRLYVSPGSPNSRMAVQNIKEILEMYLTDRCELEVIDLFDEPMRALEDGVMLTPMLLLVSSDPPVRIIGNLNDPAPVLKALEVVPDERAG